MKAKDSTCYSTRDKVNVVKVLWSKNWSDLKEVSFLKSLGEG